LKYTFQTFLGQGSFIKHFVRLFFASKLADKSLRKIKEGLKLFSNKAFK
jgi:hypothetical protein